MPCNTIQLSKIEFKLESTDMNLFEASMLAQGWHLSQQISSTDKLYSRGRESLRIKNGAITLKTQKSQAEAMSEVKMAYSREVVKNVAVRFGWKSRKVDDNTYEFQK